MGTTKCISHLPDELLVEIFTHLDFDDLVHSVQNVTSRWNDVAHDAHLWKKLQYHPAYETSDDEIVKIMLKVPNLRTLLLDKRGVCFPVINALIENCSELKKLAFNFSQKLSLKSIKHLVQNCQNIEELNVPDKCLQTLKSGQFIGQFQNLKKLSIVGWSDQPLLLRPIADGCPSLTHIDLVNHCYSNDDLAYFMQKKQNQLLNLKVKWSGEEGKCTLPVLTVCKTLKKLHIAIYCDIDITRAFDALQSMQSVTSLTLRSLDTASVNNMINVFNNKAMCQLVELTLDYYENYDDRLAETICKNCPQLKVLCLTDCFAMTDMSLQTLHTLKELEHLSVRGCSNITDIGMDHILKCKRLKHLNISCCSSLTKQCMGKLIDLNLLETLELEFCDITSLALELISSRLTRLTFLNLNYCRGVNREAVDRLKAEMPHLHVHDVIDEYYSGGDEEDDDQNQDEGVEGEQNQDAEGEGGQNQAAVAVGGQNQDAEAEGGQNQAAGGEVEQNQEAVLEHWPEIIDNSDPDILYDDAPFLFEQLLKY